MPYSRSSAFPAWLHKARWLSPAILGLSLWGAAIGVQAADKVVGGIKTPESVLAYNGRIFVSEIAEFGKDGDGRIVEITKDGKVDPFATGLNDPKGLTAIGNNIYVTDKDRVVKVGPNGKWSVLADSSAFPAKPQFLNDIEPDGHGGVFVSDSGDIEKGSGGALYQVSAHGKVTLIIDGKQDERVLAPNGIVVKNGGKSLLYVDFASGILYELDLKSKALKEIAQGFGGGDGLVRTRDGRLFVSDWKGGKVYEVVQGKAKLVKDGYQAAADIALSADGHELLVPDMKAGEVHWLPLP